MSEEEKLLRDAKKLPWEDRLLHKNWKVRNEANIDLIAVCDSITDPKDPRLREFGMSPPSSSHFLWGYRQICDSLFLRVDLCIPFFAYVMSRWYDVVLRCFAYLRWFIGFEFCFQIGPLFKKTVADSNVPVQEKALDALIAFLRAADSDAARSKRIRVCCCKSYLVYLFMVILVPLPFHSCYLKFLIVNVLGVPRKYVTQLRPSASLEGQRRWRRPRLHLCYGLNWKLLMCSWCSLFLPWTSFLFHYAMTSI